MKRSISRQDAFERVSGQAVFTRDCKPSRNAYAKILLSPYAHARIIGIDTSKAQALVGVRTYSDSMIRISNSITNLSPALRCRGITTS